MPLLALLGMIIVIPLTQSSGWRILEYRGIPPHRVAFTSAGLTIAVDRSASPIARPLDAPRRIVGLQARGRVTGVLATTAREQGTSGHDDFVLRIGLVEAGAKRPNALQRRLAPPWVRQLFALAPPGAGIAQIRFFNVGLESSQRGWTRRHPKSELLSEKIVTAPDDAGRFEIDVRMDPLEVLAVWLAADGDDTGSRFEVLLEHLQLVSE